MEGWGGGEVIALEHWLEGSLLCWWHVFVGAGFTQIGGGGVRSRTGVGGGGRLDGVRSSGCPFSFLFFFPGLIVLFVKLSVCVLWLGGLLIVLEYILLIGVR